MIKKVFEGVITSHFDPPENTWANIHVKWKQMPAFIEELVFQLPLLFLRLMLPFWSFFAILVMVVLTTEVAVGITMIMMLIIMKR